MPNNQRISGAQTTPRSESDIRVNFADTTKIIAGSNDTSGGAQAQFYSTDSGGSWNQTTLPINADDNMHSDPCVDWTSDGTAWALTIGIDATQTKLHIRCYKSTDNGASWKYDADASGKQTSTDKPMMWIDHSPSSPHKDNIYAIWHNDDPVFVNRRTGPKGAWQAPIQISGAETKGTGIGGDIKTNSDGDVFAFWPDTVIAPTNANPNPATQGALFVSKSTDGGATFGKPVKIAATFDSYDIGIPSFAIRRALIYVSGGAYKTAMKDLVYAIWTDQEKDPGTANNHNNEPDTDATSSLKTRIWFSRSTDGGASWSKPVMINNQASKNDQYNPKLAVDESTGQLVVVYYDTVADTKRLKTDLWMQTSEDDGVTWSDPVKVTTAQTDETDASADTGNQYGDYNGLSGYAGIFLPSWTDRRNGTNEEIWTAGLSTVRECTIVTDRSTFGKDEIDALLKLNNPGIIDAAFYVIVDGFTPAELGIMPADLMGVPNAKPTITLIPNITGMQLPKPTALKAEDSNLTPNQRQRFTWIYQISFTDTTGFPANVGDTTNVTLTASIKNVTGSAVMQLIHEPNPYEVDGPVSWLSTDLRVFQIKAGDSKFNVKMGNTPADASAFIKQVITNLNTGNTGGQTFENDLSLDEQVSKLELSEKVNGTAIFNFAIAKVRYRALNADATDVRVFFRLFPVSTTSTSFDTSTNYRSGTIAGSGTTQDGQKIPLLGINNGELVTIPCFAEPRRTGVDLHTQIDPANVQKINHDGSGNEVHAYFGCWLDINQPSQKLFPLQPMPADGPFMNNLKTIQELIRNAHQCLIAEISFDPDPVIPGATPGSSDKIAQRNLSIVASDNPGGPASHRIPNTFDIKPTHPVTPLQKVDELMIDWQNTPHDSMATIYLPSLNVNDILNIADRWYITHRLIRVDDHTLQCPTDSITYIPILQNNGKNIAGLLTVDLPSTVKKGQIFKIIIRQITNIGIPSLGKPYQAQKSMYSAAQRISGWRRILGTYQITIPVRTKELILEPEERLLSVLRWIQKAIPQENRWYLVFQRYVDQIADRVQALGGDPSQIEPSPSGEWHKHHKHDGKEDERHISFRGKVSGLRYDHFGDFRGFLLETEDGERFFRSGEKKVEEIVRRAWEERILTIVFTEIEDQHIPTAIILR